MRSILIYLIVLLASLPVEAQTFQHVWSKPIVGEYSFDGKWIVGRTSDSTLVRYRGADGEPVDTIRLPVGAMMGNDVAIAGSRLVTLTRMSHELVGFLLYNDQTEQWDTANTRIGEFYGDGVVACYDHQYRLFQLASDQWVGFAHWVDCSDGPGENHEGSFRLYNAVEDTIRSKAIGGPVSNVSSSGDGTRMLSKHLRSGWYRDEDWKDYNTILTDYATLLPAWTRQELSYYDLRAQPMGEGTLLKTASEIVDMSTKQVISADHLDGRLGYALKGPNYCVGYIPDNAEQIGIPIILYDIFTRESIAIDTLAYSSEAPHWPYVWGSDPAKVIHVRYNGITHRYTYDSLPPPTDLNFTVSADTAMMYDTITVNAVTPAVNVGFVAFDGKDTIYKASTIRVTSAWEQDTSLRYILKYPNGTTREVPGPTLHFRRPPGSDFMYRARTGPILHLRSGGERGMSVQLEGRVNQPNYVNGTLVDYFHRTYMMTDSIPERATDNTPRRVDFDGYPAAGIGRFRVDQNTFKFGSGDPATPRYNTQYIYYQNYEPVSTYWRLVDEFDWDWGRLQRPNDSPGYPSAVGNQHLYQFHYNPGSNRWVVLLQVKSHTQSWVNDPVGGNSRLSSLLLTTEEYSGISYNTRGAVFSVDTEHESDAVLSHYDHVDVIDLLTGDRRILIDSFPGGGIMDAKLYADELLVTSVGIFRESGGTWNLTHRWPFADGWDVVKLNYRLSCIVRHNADTVGVIVDHLTGDVVRWLGASHSPARTGEYIAEKQLLVIGDEYGVISGYYVTDVVSVDEGEAPFTTMIRVYPTITSDQLTIELPNDARDLQIVNLLGEIANIEVQQSGDSIYTLNVAGLAPGPYYVMARIGNEIMYGRFIVQ